MFTGIIYDTGKVKNKILRNGFLEITIHLNKEIKNASKGMSIAVNGACLTAKKIVNLFEFSADLSEETMNRTTFKEIKIGDKVNIELPVTTSDFFSGHLVSGHIDTVGKVYDIINKNNNTVIKFQFPEEFKNYIIEKGSIAIDGVSLTAYNVKDDKFDVSIIPETLKNTIISEYKKNRKVNLEFDLIGKYVNKILKKE